MERRLGLGAVAAYPSCGDRWSALLRRNLHARLQAPLASHDVERRIQPRRYYHSPAVLYSGRNKHGWLSGHIIRGTISRSGVPAESGRGFHRPDRVAAEPERSNQRLHHPTFSPEKLERIGRHIGGEKR